MYVFVSFYWQGMETADPAQVLDYMNLVLVQNQHFQRATMPFFGCLYANVDPNHANTACSWLNSELSSRPGLYFSFTLLNRGNAIHYYNHQ